MNEHLNILFSHQIQKEFRKAFVEADEIQLKAAGNVTYQQIQNSDCLKQLRKQDGGQIAKIGEIFVEAFGMTMQGHSKCSMVNI
ncbi:MAG: hypothetical protein EZS28_036393 [Streblomastix strix]|uniref:Uncharacterized protein n=1 Tax=Streblomastix strix TaxID=222440 RepID=A0A5J4UCZ6_9EUKA|nr:MAG: hypothetical protein EZS28_036393 [Streblomastix strix]